MAEPRFTEWFRYFPDDYRWSAALALAHGSKQRRSRPIEMAGH